MNGQLSAFHALVSGQLVSSSRAFRRPTCCMGRGGFHQLLRHVCAGRYAAPVRRLRPAERGQGARQLRRGQRADRQLRLFRQPQGPAGPRARHGLRRIAAGLPVRGNRWRALLGRGVVSNTPLAQVVGAENMRDTLAFQVDLWPARGGLPTSLEEVAERQKDIQYSSRTRLVTDQLRRVLKLRHGLQKLLARLPESEAARPTGRAAPAVAHAGDQHRQPDLRVQAPRALFQGLRVRHRGHARALGVRPVGHPPDPGPAGRAGPSDRGQLFCRPRHPSQRQAALIEGRAGWGKDRIFSRYELNLKGLV